MPSSVKIIEFSTEIILINEMLAMPKKESMRKLVCTCHFVALSS